MSDRNSRPTNVEISYGESQARQTARYVSGTTVREEALQRGRLIGLYWSASGHVQRENVTGGLPGLDPLAHSLQTFELEIDGQSLHNRWEWVSASECAGARRGTVEAVVELRHLLRPVSVRAITRLDGSPVMARWLQITNTGEAPAALSHVAPWSGVLWNTDPAWNPSVQPKMRYSLGYLAPENPGQEGDFAWHSLPEEGYRVERVHGRSHGSPYFVLRNEITGELCFIGLAWSGNYFAEFTNRPDTLLSFAVGPLGPAPLRVIAPGETVCSPEVHLGMMHSSFDSAVHAWHEHLRASVVPPRPQGKEMYTVAGRVVEEPDKWILREVDIAAEMAVEAFMVDAGWYGEDFTNWWEQRGNWFEGDWLPGGIAGIRDYTHDKGMLFGLWMEPETVMPKSRLFREHPDWVLRTDDGAQVSDVLNLAYPDAAKYLEDSVLRVIRDFKLDFYKLDYNATTHEGGQNVTEGYAEHESWRHFETIYKLYDRVREEHPGVALENCASGGGRNDLGMMSHFHYCCESDFSTFPLSIRAINSMTLFLPPEAICYYHNHIHYAHHCADLDTHLRVTLFAVPVFVGFGAQDADRLTPYFAKTREYIELAKTFCRPILAQSPVVFHHTPDIGVLGAAEWCVLEYASQDRLRGYAGVFRLSRMGANEYVFRPRGLDLAHDYEVTLHNSGQRFRVTGRELSSVGIVVTLDASLTSELLLFDAGA